jgi:hypothetical protein
MASRRVQTAALILFRIAAIPAVHPIGTGAIVTPIPVDRATNSPDLTVSTFLVD